MDYDLRVFIKFIFNKLKTNIILYNWYLMLYKYNHKYNHMKQFKRDFFSYNFYIKILNTKLKITKANTKNKT